MVTPVFRNQDIIGAVAFKIDTQAIYKLTSNYEALGKTGEILLCLRTGNELTFANPLRHDAQAAFKRKVAMGSPIALPAQKSLQGINGFGESTDYRDKKVLAVWRYLPAPRWGMVVKIDSQEAYAPVFTVRNWSLLVGILVTGMGMLAALFVSKSISHPIQMLQRGVEMVGSGNLDYQVGISSEDEIGRLSRAFDAMTENLKNITASRDELNQIARELERSNQELQQFAYVASHDLQEPLRMVAGFTRLLERRYKDKLDQDAREFINFAVDGAVRMQKLIDDLLTYSRVGMHNIPFEPADCNRLLDQAITNLRVAIEESQAVITSSNLPTATCNGSQMVQLFQNLLSNAIKFRGAETPRIRIAAEHRDSEWLFSFRDNGIGIDPHYKDRIFQIFQRLHSRDEYEGTGIGLALCMKIVELHKGKIWMESEEGKGATFYFTLPDREKTV
jgi:signal transduction histidine kinase